MSAKFELYCCDTETTNLIPEGPNAGDIIEISIYRLSDNNQKTWFLKPSSFDNIQADALRINGHKLEDLKGLTKFGKDTYEEPNKVIAEIENWFMSDGATSDDRILCGQNIGGFDLRFMQNLWAKQNSMETFPFGARPKLIDTMQLALAIDFVNDTRSDYYNLGSLVEKYGVKKLKAHRAEQDTIMTKDVLLQQFKLIKK